MNLGGWPENQESDAPRAGVIADADMLAPTRDTLHTVPDSDEPSTAHDTIPAPPPAPED